VNAASITAPSDGLIIAVNLLTGVNAPSGYAIEESVGPMVASASFSESDVTKLKVGQSATVSVTAAAASVAGTLTQIVPVASTSGGSSSVASYAVTVTLTSPPTTVLAGMSATVTVTTASVANALRVPATALTGNSTAGYAVQVLNGTTVSTVSVQVGLVTTSYAQITGGLTAGQEVVVGSTAARTGTSNTSSGVNLNSLTGAGNVPGGGAFGR
jgi:multidrug efflux pump subunit AcrA (membrane-fusion protein)